MLKSFVETGEVHSKTTYQGDTSAEGFKYIGFKKSGPIKNIDKMMEEDFGKLFKMMSNGELREPKIMLSIYPKYGMINGEVGYIAGFGYGETPEEVKGMVRGDIPNHQAICSFHKGEYQYLGNDWSAAY